MSIRGLIALLLLVGALGLGWQQRQRLQGWAGAATLPAAPSLGLNEAQQPADASSRPMSRFRAGELRKCVKGQQVSYANVECPPGTKEQAVTGGAVTVVPGTPVARPAETASGPSALHKALDITRDDTLRDKIMERQMEGAR